MNGGVADGRKKRKEGKKKSVCGGVGAGVLVNGRA